MITGICFVAHLTVVKLLNFNKLGYFNTLLRVDSNLRTMTFVKKEIQIISKKY